MSFFGVQEIIENCNYLNALNEEKAASTDILLSLIPFDDPKVKAIEDRLRASGALTFDTVFSEPTGFYLLAQYLQRELPQHSDKAMFLSDIQLYSHMRFENARTKVAKLIYERYLLMREPPPAEAPLPKGKAKPVVKKPVDEEEMLERKDARMSVFEAMRRRNREKRSENGGSRSNSIGGNGVEGPTAASLPGLRSSSATREDLPKPGADSSSDRAYPNTPRGVQDDADNGEGESQEANDDEAGDDEPGSARDSKVNEPKVGRTMSHSSNRSGAKSNAPPAKTTTTRGRVVSAQVTSSKSPPRAVSSNSSKENSYDANEREESKTGAEADNLANFANLPPVQIPANWINDIQAPADAVSKVVRFLDANMAPRSLFKQIAEDVHNVMVKEVFPEFIKSPAYRKYIQTKILEEAHVGPEDFATMRLLGRGGFGTVYACRKIDSGKLYAMKAINKKLIKWKKAVAMTMLERHTLSLVQSRFVCSLSYAFQDKSHLFLIMDLMAGGDLKFHLTKARNTTPHGGFPEARARFHAAEILLGLEAMHSKNIIFRDLKLENVLMDDEGHCKISDLGLVALYGQKKVNHYAGTPGYIAPEVTKKQPYGPAVDIFSYGVTLYRMLSGKKPFKGHTRQDFDRAVCNDEPQFDPEVFSPHAISLLKGLMEKEPKRRLGCGKGGTQVIKDHPFFSSIDWGLLEIGYVDPPFTPSRHDVNANSLEDIGYEDADAKQYEKIVLDDKFKKQVHGFDYVSKQAVRTEIVASLKKQAEEDAVKKKNKSKGKLGTGGDKCCTVL